MKTLPYELHVTVKPDGEEAKRRFVDICADLGVKALFITNISRKGSTTHELLTADQLTDWQPAAKSRLAETSAKLREGGLSVMRSKIETVPWHEAASGLNVARYFESHHKVDPGVFDIGEVVRRAAASDLHVSTVENLQTCTARVFATHRLYRGSLARFSLSNQIAVNALSDAFTVEEGDIEYALFDDNPDHDIQWMQS